MTRSGATFCAMRHRLGGADAEFLIRQMTRQPVSIADQRVHQGFSRGGVVPGDRRFTRVVLVVSAALCGDHLTSTGCPLSMTGSSGSGVATGRTIRRQPADAGARPLWVCDAVWLSPDRVIDDLKQLDGASEGLQSAHNVLDDVDLFVFDVSPVTLQSRDYQLYDIDGK